MLAMVGLVIDGGMSYAEFRRTQTAADSSALAAATYLWKNTTAQCSATSSTPSSDACGGLNYASVQGYRSDTGATVTVTHPAANSGTYSSTQYATYGDYVYVTISRPLSSFFINIIFQGSIKVEASAIAGISRVPMNYALFSLGSPCSSSANGTSPAANGGIIVSGGGNLTVNNGAMFSNCTGSPAVNVTGSGNLSGDGIQTSGTCSGVPSSVSCDTGLAQQSDPMGSLTWPCSTAGSGNQGTSVATYGYCRYQGSVTGNVGTIVIDPGVYDVISPSGNSTVWLRSGVYVIRGGVSNEALDFAGSTGIRDCGASGAPSQCSGHTGGEVLVNATNEYDATRSTSNPEGVYPNPCNDNVSPSPTGSGISLTGNSGFQLTAMTSGPFSGLTVWQACGLGNTISLTGSSASSITGTVYAPNALVNLDGSASWTTPSAIVSKYIRLKGSADLTINYNHSTGYKPYNVVLVQ